MKTLPHSLLALGAVIALPFATRADTTPTVVSSEIVGFASFDVPGASQAGQAQVSLKSIGLLRHVEYEGVAETARGKQITDKQAIWTDNQYNPLKATVASATYFLELTTGPFAGAFFDIVRTEAKTQRLTLGQALPAAVGRNPGFRIRQHWTLAALFGAADEFGLQPGDATTADLVEIYNGKNYDQFYYSTGGTVGIGWRRVGGKLVDEAGRQIYPDDGITIERRTPGEVSGLIKGVLKTDRALISVRHGTNVIANAYPSPIKLAQSNLFTSRTATGIQAGATAAASDNVLIFNGTSYDTYYYQSNVRLSSGWRRLGDVNTDAGNTEIPTGGAVIIRRRSANGFNWLPPIPGQP